MTTVAAIIPTYNDAHRAARAVESVLQQTRLPDEIIVVDDGSAEDARPRFAHFGPRVRCLRQTNGGLSAARNAGIEATRADFVAFLDADDLWMPDKTELQLRQFEEHPEYGFSFTDLEVRDEESGRASRWFDRKQHTAEGWILRPLYEEVFILPSTVMVRQAALAEVGLFDPRLRHAGDYDLWLRLALEYPAGCLRKPLVIRRVGRDNMSRDWLVDLFDRLDILRKLGASHPPETFPAPDYLVRTRARMHRSIGYLLLRRGDPARARSHYLSSLRLQWQPELLPRIAALFVLPRGLVRRWKGSDTGAAEGLGADTSHHPPSPSARDPAPRPGA